MQRTGSLYPPEAVRRDDWLYEPRKLCIAVRRQANTISTPNKTAPHRVWGHGGRFRVSLDYSTDYYRICQGLFLGKGKKLFDNGAIPAAFSLTESLVTQTGVIIANYTRAGEVKTGTAGA